MTPDFLVDSHVNNVAIGLDNSAYLQGWLSVASVQTVSVLIYHQTLRPRRQNLVTKNVRQVTRSVSGRLPDQHRWDLDQLFEADGPLHSPWGLALARSNFGPFSNAVLVGNNIKVARSTPSIQATENFWGT